MNSVQLIGRLTRDPEIRYTGSGSSIARFSIAVDRRFKQEGSDTADFINCVKTAEFIEKFFNKGKKIALIGHIQTGSYTNNDGAKVYTTDVIAEQVEFVESKSSVNEVTEKGSNTFVNIPDGIEETIPFD